MSDAGDFAADPAAWTDARRVETRAAQELGPICDDPAAVAQVTDSVAPWLEEQERSGEKDGSKPAA